MDVRKGDTVLVLAGKDRGKRGTVERVEKTKRGFGVVIPGSTWPSATSARARGRRRPGSSTSRCRSTSATCRSSARAATSRRASAHGQLEGEHGRSTRVCKRCGEQIEVTSK